MSKQRLTPYFGTASSLFASSRDGSTFQGNIMRLQSFIAALVLGVLASLTGIAYATSHVQASGTEASAALTEGEVRRVDRDAKKLTIRHGPIASLDMPPMTMVFQVRDEALLAQLKTGDRIRFSAERIGGVYVVTQVEPAR
jgi:Cu/Ag efflux protein CusF